jgi:hypothetical protein
MRIYVWVCLGACSLTHSARNRRVSFSLRPLWLHHIFRHYLINDTIFGKKLLDVNCVFRFSLQLLYEIFLIVRRIQGDVINVKTSSLKYSLFLSDFNETFNFLGRYS